LARTEATAQAHDSYVVLIAFGVATSLDLDNRSVLATVFYMDRPNGYMVAAGRAFLFENRLSLFRR
jgi:hypothetical protein